MGSKLILLLFFLMMLGLVRFLLRSFLGPSPNRSRRGYQFRSGDPGRTISGQMVKDPHCGMYVATELTVTARVNGETVHFCSPVCRDAFIQEHKSAKIAG